MLSRITNPDPIPIITPLKHGSKEIKIKIRLNCAKKIGIITLIFGQLSVLMQNYVPLRTTVRT